MATNEPTLTVVTLASSSLRMSRDPATKLTEEEIPLDKLQQNFTRFLRSLQHMVAVDQARVGQFLLDEITFSAEIGLEGEFKLMGTGMGASVTSGVTFTLRRQVANTNVAPQGSGPSTPDYIA